MSVMGPAGKGMEAVFEGIRVGTGAGPGTMGGGGPLPTGSR